MIQYYRNVNFLYYYMLLYVLHVFEHDKISRDYKKSVVIMIVFTEASFQGTQEIN